MKLKLVVLIGLSVAVSCASARPHVNVVAMSQSQGRGTTQGQPEVLVYMEVVNPTGRELQLSRLEYQLSADSWFESQGAVELVRRVAAKSATLVEIAVPVAELEGKSSSGVPYRLRGRLFAKANHVERSWPVDASGEIETRAATFVVSGSSTRIGSRDSY